jgi:hypothetical protein
MNVETYIPKVGGKPVLVVQVTHEYLCSKKVIEEINDWLCDWNASFRVRPTREFHRKREKSFEVQLRWLSNDDLRRFNWNEYLDCSPIDALWRDQCTTAYYVFEGDCIYVKPSGEVTVKCMEDFEKYFKKVEG